MSADKYEIELRVPVTIESTHAHWIDRSARELRRDLEQYWLDRDQNILAVCCGGISLDMNWDTRTIAAKLCCGRTDILFVQFWLQETSSDKRYFVNLFAEHDGTVCVQPQQSVSIPVALQTVMEQHCARLLKENDNFVRKQRQWFTVDLARIQPLIDNQSDQNVVKMLKQQGY